MEKYHEHDVQITAIYAVLFSIRIIQNEKNVKCTDKSATKTNYTIFSGK